MKIRSIKKPIITTALLFSGATAIAGWCPQTITSQVEFSDPFQSCIIGTQVTAGADVMIHGQDTTTEYNTCFFYGKSDTDVLPANTTLNFTSAEIEQPDPQQANVGNLLCHYSYQGNNHTFNVGHNLSDTSSTVLEPQGNNWSTAPSASVAICTQAKSTDCPFSP